MGQKRSPEDRGLKPGLGHPGTRKLSPQQCVGIRFESGKDKPAKGRG